MLFLSQIAVLAVVVANGGSYSGQQVPLPQPRPAVIYHVQIAPPISFAHLDWSRTTNPQYNLMMNNIESMVPKTAEQFPRVTIVTRHEAPQEPATGLTEAGKLSVTVFAALMASAVILRLLLRRKPV